MISWPTAINLDRKGRGMTLNVNVRECKKKMISALRMTELPCVHHGDAKSSGWFHAVETLKVMKKGRGSEELVKADKKLLTSQMAAFEHFVKF